MSSHEDFPEASLLEGFPEPPILQEINEDKRNGLAYSSFLPSPSAPINETLRDVGDYGDFTETPEIVDELLAHRHVLVSGAPGSGKSHLVKEIQMGCIANSLPVFVLSMHINAGKTDGVERIQPHLDEFIDKTRETGGGLVILDNLDYVGYKGKSRTVGKAAQYAESAQDMVEGLLAEPSLVVMGTIHDETWREGRWSWQNEDVDGPARAILEAFPVTVTFEGKMALVGLAHILRARNFSWDREDPKPIISLGKAAQVIRLLRATNRANFFHANHLDVELFLRDPDAAIRQIEQGRQSRSRA
jgi:hypothetical protein